MKKSGIQGICEEARGALVQFLLTAIVPLTAVACELCRRCQQIEQSQRMKASIEQTVVSMLSCPSPYFRGKKPVTGPRTAY